MTSKAVGIDSESLLFAKLQEYSIEIHNLIFRRQYNDRRKITLSLCNTIRERIAAEIDGGEDYFCIDSKPIEVCRFARSKRCRRMMTDNELCRLSTRRLTVFLRQVSKNSPPNRTYTSRRIRLSTNFFFSLNFSQMPQPVATRTQRNGLAFSG